MLKFLKKLPIEGLLIIIVVLASIIVLIYLTKIHDVIDSNTKIVVKNIESGDNRAKFVSENDIDSRFILTNPIKEDIEKKPLPDVKQKIRLFFIKVDNDGEITLKSVIRSIYVGGSPLTKTLDQLLIGPATDDINRGLLTLIPDGTEILSISIKNEIAFINLNEQFRFNQLGVEGYLAQIKQIVSTATEFDSVGAVQFLIDGAIQEFLGPEGVYIGRPISLEDLNL